MHGYREFRHIQDTRVRDTRALMDTLAASNWGAKIPGKTLFVFKYFHLYFVIVKGFVHRFSFSFSGI